MDIYNGLVCVSEVSNYSLCLLPVNTFEIEHKENFEESVHKTFFAFFETYYKKTQESKIFLATKY